MGEAKRRQQAGQYPALTSRAEDEAAMRALLADFPPALQSERVAHWMEGHEVTLTPAELDEVDAVLRRLSFRVEEGP